MRTILFLGATVVGLACAGDATVPLRVPATASVTFSNTPGDTSVVARGDSAVVEMSFPYTCSGAVMARAGGQGGSLVVTITDSLSAPVPCAYLAGYRIYHATVGPLRSGSYPVELRFRDVVASSVSGSVVSRTTVTIP